MTRLISGVTLGALLVSVLAASCADNDGNTTDGGGGESGSVGGSSATGGTGGASATTDGGAAGMETGGSGDGGSRTQSTSAGGAGGADGAAGGTATGSGGTGGAGAGGAGDSCDDLCDPAQTCHDGRCISWQEPVLLTEEVSEGGLPTIAMNDAGAAVLVWWVPASGDDPEYGNVWASDYAPDTGWTRVERRLDGADGRPCVAINDAGTAVAAWKAAWIEADYDLIVASHEAGSAWGPVEPVTDGTIAMFNGPRSCAVQLDATGRTQIVWTTGGDGIWARVRVEPFPESEGLPAPFAIQDDDDSSDDDYSDASLAMTPAGDAIAVWAHTTQGGQHRVRAAHLGTDSETATVENVATLAGRSGMPAIAIDDQGSAIALWGDAVETDGAVLWASHFSPAEGWEEAEQVGTVDPDSSPRIVMDGEGNATAAWCDDNGVWASAYNVGSGWGTPERIGDFLVESPWFLDYRDRYDLRVAGSEAGDVVVVWPQVSASGSDEESSEAQVWSNRYTPGLGWGAPELVDAIPATFIYFDVAVDGQGTAMLAWGDTDDLWVSRSSRPD